MIPTQFQSWQSVKVIDEGLEDHGRAGTVRSASEYVEGKKTLVDVQLDGDSEPKQFEASQIAPI